MSNGKSGAAGGKKILPRNSEIARSDLQRIINNAVRAAHAEPGKVIPLKRVKTPESEKREKELIDQLAAEIAKGKDADRTKADMISYEIQKPDFAGNKAWNFFDSLAKKAGLNGFGVSYHKNDTVELSSGELYVDIPEQGFGLLEVLLQTDREWVEKGAALVFKQLALERDFKHGKHSDSLPAKWFPDAKPDAKALALVCLDEVSKEGESPESLREQLVSGSPKVIEVLASFIAFHIVAEGGVEHGEIPLSKEFTSYYFPWLSEKAVKQIEASLSE